MLCLTIVLSPLYVVRWSYFGQFPTTLLELLVWLTTGAWVISKLTVHDLNLKLDQSLRWPVVIITTAVLISTLIAQDRWAALGILRAYFLEPFVIYFIAVDLFSRLKHFQFSTLNSQFSIPQLIWLSLLTAGIWLSLLGITQFLFHWPVFTAHQL
ncbi:MAG TPA: hypothetical protein VGA08_04095, partial [Candidatus Saccharimonadales bacterium]